MRGLFSLTDPVGAGAERMLGLTCPRCCATIFDMELKKFGKFLRGKSVSQLLHRARKESSKRILANAEDLEGPRKARALKRTGTR